MSITERMENDGMTFQDAVAKESLYTGPLPPAWPAVDSIESLLAERSKTHGDFRVHAQVTKELKTAFYSHVVGELTAVQEEAVDMILHKLGRIAAGNPHFQNHWDDIAGYSKLVSQDLARR